MHKLKITMMTVLFAVGARAMAEAPPTFSLQNQQATEAQIKSQYEVDKEACNSMTGNARDICLTVAKGKEKVARAELEAYRNNTEEARYRALISRAEVEYDIAKERCDDLTDNSKEVCQKDAKAALVTAKANAEAKLKSFKAMEKAEDKTSQAQKNVDRTVTDIQKGAAGAKQDANYAAAKERCDSLAGGAREACINEAKARYGRL